MIAAIILVLTLTMPDGSIRTTGAVMPSLMAYQARATEFITPRRGPAGQTIDEERPRWATCLSLPVIGADA